MNVRVNLLAIFVLSICSNYALAQFDTVINLPENPDSPNPSGFSGNSIGRFSGISSNTQLNVSDGGSIGFQFDAGAEDVSNTNIEVNISGGAVGFDFDANSGSTVNISGGDVGFGFNANSGSTVNISGGTFGNNFQAFDGSTVNLFGTEFFLNGSLIDASTLGEPFTIFDRGEDVVLSGVFADGTPFDFDLDPNDFYFSPFDFFDPNSTLTITRVVAVPEPGCGLTLATMSLVLLVRRRRALR